MSIEKIPILKRAVFILSFACVSAISACTSVSTGGKSVDSLTEKNTMHDSGLAAITYSAIGVFKNTESGVAMFYPDTARNALAIDAANPRLRNVYVSAMLTLDQRLPSRKYRVSLVTLGETDGESKYRVFINDKLISELQNREVNEDYKELIFDLGLVYLSPGDKITVSAMAHTNGKIPEGNETAYARGRWRSLVIK